MDVLFVYRGQQFMWDSNKAASNFAKHGIPFETACEAFFDSSFLIEDASADDEQRFALTGALEAGTILLVVHLVRNDDVIRLISARAATAQERWAYEEGD